MDFMRGKFLIAQLALYFLGALFFVIAYGGGIWWRMETKGDYKVSLTLWWLCSQYGDTEGCVSLTDSDYMQSVILTTQACGGIVIVLLVPLFVLMLFLVYKVRSDSKDGNFLYIRTVLFLLLQLFLLVTVAHSQNCPPKFKFGATQMKQFVAWGWDLALTALVFLLAPCVFHCIESVKEYRST